MIVSSFGIDLLVKYLSSPVIHSKRLQLCIQGVCLGCLTGVAAVASETGKINTSYELLSLTLGARWAVMNPANIYLDQTGQCQACSPAYETTLWLVEGSDAGLDKFRSFIGGIAYRSEPGCNMPDSCPPSQGIQNFYIVIDSKGLRKWSAGVMDYPSDIHNYCLQVGRLLILWGDNEDNRIADFQRPEMATFCFSELPMPEHLVVYTRADYLGDHDCGVYPPRGQKQGSRVRANGCFYPFSQDPGRPERP